MKSDARDKHLAHTGELAAITPATPHPVIRPDIGGREAGERDGAFAAFCMYRDMGNSRSLQEVANRLSKNLTTIKRWSSRWGWVERAVTWDAEQDRVRREAELAAVRKMRERHASETLALQGEFFLKLKALLEKVDPSQITSTDAMKGIGALATAYERMASIEREARGADAPPPAAPQVIIRFEDKSLNEARVMIAAIAPHLSLAEQERIIAEHSRAAGIDVPEVVIDVEGVSGGSAIETSSRQSRATPAQNIPPETDHSEDSDV